MFDFDSIFSLRLDALIVILGMAGVTYGFRLGGLILADRMPDHGALAVGLQRLPGLVLLSLTAPAVLEYGPSGWVVAGIVALVGWKTGNLLLSILSGTIIVALLRFGGIAV